MVLVHEAGHFAAAKICRVRVEAFAFGFGPRLFGLKYGDTDYKVCLLPLGGFVKMTGENPSDQSAEEIVSDPGAFTSHPRWQRMLIGVAGPTANFLLTFVLMFVYFAFVNEVPLSAIKTTTVEWVTPDSPAAQAGIRSGDIVRRFGGVSNPKWQPQVYEQIKLSPGQNVAVTVDRAGKLLDLSLHIPMTAKSDDFDIGDTGIQPQYLPGPIAVAQVQSGTPAEHAGLRAGDAIESVDGHAFHSVNSLLAYMQTEKGKPMALAIRRNGTTLQMVATPAKLDTAWKLGFVPEPIPFRDEPLPLASAVTKSATYFAGNSLLVAEIVERLFTHKLSLTQMTGPVGIARAAGEVAEMDGWSPKFGLAAEISLQLGIFNLFPFPMLDGGMILLLLIESAIRHDISLAIKERIYTAAFVVLVAFFAFVLFNDVSKLPLFTHTVP